MFASAASAARGLGLDSDKTVRALGIAGTQSAGLMAAQVGRHGQRMHAGRSAQSGLYGGLLAANGFTGIIDVFEARYGGFASTFSRSYWRPNLEELRSGLRQLRDAAHRAQFYSCVGSNHANMDTIRDIQARRPFKLDEIKEIVVKGSRVRRPSTSAGSTGRRA